MGVHQIILDSPVFFAICRVCNGRAYKHHAPLVRRRTDGLVQRTVDVIRGQGFSERGPVWASDGTNLLAVRRPQSA
ncbi:hypothetical protein [Streptomyces sp. KL116D]|uniref:hypothetical protein n=1 Tax=Streptomyces sp. KL116D TaxID=3045152 RepID=UPI003558084C